MLSADESTTQRLRTRSGCRGRFERCILSQDRLLELPQLPPRLDPEHLDQGSSPIRVCGQCLSIAARPIEREHQVPAQSLSQRMVPHECLELTDEVAAAAGGQIGLDPVLEARQPRLLQTGNLRLREAVMAEIGERRPSPQRERLDQPPVLPEPLEALEIELVCVDTQ